MIVVNRHNSSVFDTLLEAMLPLRQARSRPRNRLTKLHADKGYDFRKCRQELCKRGIKSCIARSCIEASQCLGRHRWIVERTFTWLKRFRRLRVRYERCDDIHLAFSKLACDSLLFEPLNGFVRRSKDVAYRDLNIQLYK